jgi:hypothetical protein
MQKLKRDEPIALFVERPYIGDDFRHLILLHAAASE